MSKIYQPLFKMKCGIKISQKQSVVFIIFTLHLHLKNL